MYPFRPLLSGPREMNYGNTVLVQREVGVWLLGYIQDIEAENVLINFDSTTVPSTWIHVQYVWSHHLARSKLGNLLRRDGSVPLYVALRDDENGPYRFRPGKLLSRLCGFGLIYVEVDSRPLAAENVRTAAHRWQIVEELPEQEPPLFRKTAGLTYVKHVLPFVNNHPISMEHINEHSVFKFLTRARWPKKIFSGLDDESRQIVRDNGCRFYLRFEFDCLVFICAEFRSNPPNGSLSWDVQFLHNAFRDFFARHQVCNTDNGCKDNDWNNAAASPSVGLSHKRSFTKENFCLAHLARPLHMNLLCGLDFHTQAKLMRVCVVWYQLSNDSAAKRHIIIDIHNFAPNLLEDLSELNRPSIINCNPGHQLASLLDRTVTPMTRSLILRNGDDNFRTNECVVPELMKLKAIIIPTIILQDWSADSAFLLGNPNESFCGSVFRIIRACDRLLLLNYSVNNIFHMAVTLVFEWDETGQHPRFPHHEAEFVRHDDLWFKMAPKIQIPRLYFLSTETNEEMIRKFLSMCENHCPFVDNAVYDTVKAIFNRWLHTLDYPDEWEAIRDLFNLYNGFQPDGSARDWNDVDLRQLDISHLNKLTLRAISTCFSDTPEPRTE